MENLTHSPNQINQEILSKLDSLQKALIDKEKPFLTIDEASEYLGISKNTLYGYTSKNIIPFYKIQGRKLYFKIDDLNKFILNKKNRSASQSEIEEKAATQILVGKRQNRL